MSAPSTSLLYMYAWSGWGRLEDTRTASIRRPFSSWLPLHIALAEALLPSISCSLLRRGAVQTRTLPSGMILQSSAFTTTTPRHHRQQRQYHKAAQALRIARPPLLRCVEAICTHGRSAVLLASAGASILWALKASLHQPNQRRSVALLLLQLPWAAAAAPVGHASAIAKGLRRSIHYQKTLTTNY